jgi:hypothetical protein
VALAISITRIIATDGFKTCSRESLYSSLCERESHSAVRVHRIVKDRYVSLGGFLALQALTILVALLFIQKAGAETFTSRSSSRTMRSSI